MNAYLIIWMYLILCKSFRRVFISNKYEDCCEGNCVLEVTVL